MRHTSTRPRRRLLLKIVLDLLVLAAVTAVVLNPSVVTTTYRTVSSWTSSLGDVLDGQERSETPSQASESGVLPEGVTAFDRTHPGVTRLDDDLLAALREAATRAAAEGVTIEVNSGWRSPAYQDQLLREAVAEYGSTSAAARWVATAETSPHVAGQAVDVGPVQARAWLAGNGAGYGLCQIYRNEPWHFELRPQARAHGCPPMYADPTEDPRMQQ